MSSWCLAVVFFEDILIGDNTLCASLLSYIDRKFALQAVCLTKLPARFCLGPMSSRLAARGLGPNGWKPKLTTAFKSATQEVESRTAIGCAKALRMNPFTRLYFRTANTLRTSWTLCEPDTREAA